MVRRLSARSRYPLPEAEVDALQRPLRRRHPATCWRTASESACQHADPDRARGARARGRDVCGASSRALDAGAARCTERDRRRAARASRRPPSATSAPAADDVRAGRARPLAGRRAGDPVEDAVRDVLLGEQRQLLVEAARVEQADDVRVGAEAGAGRRHVVGDDQVEALARSLRRASATTSLRLGGEADEQAAALARPRAREDVRVALELERERRRRPS